MIKAWQTKINMFLLFPYRCANFKMEGSTVLKGFFKQDETVDYDDELAFWCVFDHRIIIYECLGDACPYCKLIGHDEFMARLGGLS